MPNYSGYGGAIYNSNKLIVENCIFTGNIVYNNGGAIYNDYGTLNIIGSSFSDSYAAAFGGAIYSNYGTLNLIGSNFTSNIAGITGGTIHLNGSPCTINNCSINNNLNGHAIYLDSASLNIINSTFNNNKGTVNWHYLPSGVIINMYGTLNVADSTFTNNPDSVIQNFGLYDVSYSSFNVTDSSFTNNLGTSIVNHDPRIVYIENCIFTNNTGSVGGGGAISNQGIMTVKDSTFTSNDVSFWYGGAIFNYLTDGMPYSAILTVENCIFDGNRAGSGGAICNRQNGDVTVINSTFTNNYGGRGGAFYNEGDYRTKANIMNSTFISNSGQNGGVFNNYGGSIKVNDCILKNNIAGIIGGAIYNQAAGISFEIHFSQISNNPSNSEIHNEGTGIVNAQNNWWGSNDSPVTKITGTNVYYDPWIILTVTADPAKVNTGNTSQVTVDLTHNSDNQDTSRQGHIPDGIPIQYFATLGTINNTGTTVNGRATATFKAGNNDGQATVQAKVDDQTVSTAITVGNPNNPPVLNLIGDKSINEGQNLQFTVTGTDPDGDPLTYSAIGLPDGALLNSATGEFTWIPNYNQAGTYTIIFTVSDGTLTDSKTGNLTVINIIRDYIYISPTGSDITGDGTQNSPYQTIVKAFDEVKAAGTIYLTNGIYTGTGNYGITINKDINIIGENQANTIIDAQGLDRIFTILSRVTVTIQNLTLKNGNADNGGAILNNGGATLNVIDSTFMGNHAITDGGTIYNNGALNVNNSTFANNTARGGYDSDGSAIYNTNILNVNNSTFTENHAEADGGAITSGGTSKIENSTLTSNSANRGGALDIYGTLTLNNSTFVNNSAIYGGSIWSELGTLDIKNSTFTNNSAITGGAIHSQNIITIDSSSFTGNTATSPYMGESGGAIANYGTLTVNNSTFSNNTSSSGGAIESTAGSLNVKSCIFTNNTSTSWGGAIHNYGWDSTMNVSDSTFINNTAINYGGGAISGRSTMIVTGSTFTSNKANSGGGAIANSGDITIENSIFTSNIANNFGGAIWNYGTMDIIDSTFTNNNASSGGAISNGVYDYPYEGKLTVNNSTFTDNTANNGGAISNGDTLNYGGTLTVSNSNFLNNSVTGYYPSGYGGAITNSGDLTINKSTFTGNSATSGGAICSAGTHWLNRPCSLNITESTFLSNHAIQGGGAIENWDYAEVHFNSIIGNTASTGSALYCSGGLMNAQNNWWGSNDNPATKLVYANYSPWIVLTITADPAKVNTGDTSQITADLAHNSDNQDTSSQGHLPDGIPVQFFATLGTINTTGTTVNGRATATFKAGNNDGQATVHANVDDQTVSTTITVGNPNSTPVLTPIGNKTVNEGQQLQFTIIASDPDGDKLTYTADNLPAGASLDSTTGQFTWTPNYNQSGNYSIIFSVTDGKITVSEPITIGVMNINRAPILDPIGNKTVNENQQLTITVKGSDPDGDSLTYSASGLPSGATFNSTTKTFTWTPNYNQSGNYQVTFTVSDGSLQDSKIITITVNNVNRPPTLNPITNKTVNEGQQLQFTITGTDPDGDALTYNASNLPVGVTFNSNTFTWTPNYNQAGTYTITFTVSDGNLSDTKTAKITVNNTLRNIIYISPTGDDTTGEGTQSNPYKTISRGLTEINPSGTINLANGIYSGTGNVGITININFTLNGQSQVGTIIDAQGLSRIFYISSGFNVTIQNLTMKNGYNIGDGGGAIDNGGILNVTGCTFTGNNATGLSGAIHNSGILNVTGCTFTGNNATSRGGAIYNYGVGTVIVNNSTFTNNTAYLSGGAICNWGDSLTVTNCTFTGNKATRTGWSEGGAIDNGGILNVTGCTFTGNTAMSYGGAIFNTYKLTVTNSNITYNSVTESFGGGIGNWYAISSIVTNSNITNNNACRGGGIGNYESSLTVTGSNINNNNAIGYLGAIGQGGAIWNIGTTYGSANIYFNRIFGNTAKTGSAIYCNNGTVNAQNNWWGSNANPITKISVVSGGVVKSNPWLVLSITTTNSTISTTGSAIITANLSKNSNGQDTSAQGSLPNGTPITFKTSFGKVTPTSNSTTNGKASTTLTSATAGTATVTATVDGQNISTTIKINKK